MNKILPHALPPITSFPATANLLSVLWAYKEETMPWVYDHYMQIFAEDSKREYAITGDFIDDFYANNIQLCMMTPFLNTCRLDRTTINLSNAHFYEYTTNMIDAGIYVQVCLDAYHLKCSPLFMKKHVMKSVVIYGYDNEIDEIYISSFFEGNKFCDKVITLDELNSGYHNHCISINDPNWMRLILLYKYQSCNYTINIELMKRSLNDYILGIDSFDKFKYDYTYRDIVFLYGVSYYDLLIKGMNDGIIDIRALHVLCDHKQMMLLRLGFLNENNYLPPDCFFDLYNTFEHLYKGSMKMRNKGLKYIASNKLNFKDDLITQCLQLKEEDIKASSMLLDSLI